MLFVVMVLVVPFLLFIPGKIPISSLHPWENWVPPDLHGFFRWVFDSLEVLNGFVRQVVISRRDEGIPTVESLAQGGFKFQAVRLAEA